MHLSAPSLLESREHDLGDLSASQHSANKASSFSASSCSTLLNMASIDALTGVPTERKSLGAENVIDSKPGLTPTVLETPADETHLSDHAASTHEAQEQDEGLTDRNAQRQRQRDEQRRTRSSLEPKFVAQDSEQGEDEVLDSIQVGKPALSRESPLFFTGNEHTASGGLRVKVPEVQRRWEYRVFDEEYTIRSVLRELRGLNEVKYEVKFEDGHKTLVCHPLNL